MSHNPKHGEKGIKGTPKSRARSRNPALLTQQPINLLDHDKIITTHEGTLNDSDLEMHFPYHDDDHPEPPIVPVAFKSPRRLTPKKGANDTSRPHNDGQPLSLFRSNHVDDTDDFPSLANVDTNNDTNNSRGHDNNHLQYSVSYHPYDSPMHPSTPISGPSTNKTPLKSAMKAKSSFQQHSPELMVPAVVQFTPTRRGKTVSRHHPSVSMVKQRSSTIKATMQQLHATDSRFDYPPVLDFSMIEDTQQRKQPPQPSAGAKGPHYHGDDDSDDADNNNDVVSNRRKPQSSSQSDSNRVQYDQKPPIGSSSTRKRQKTTHSDHRGGGGGGVTVPIGLRGVHQSTTHHSTDHFNHFYDVSTSSMRQTTDPTSTSQPTRGSNPPPASASSKTQRQVHSAASFPNQLNGGSDHSSAWYHSLARPAGKDGKDGDDSSDDGSDGDNDDGPQPADQHARSSATRPTSTPNRPVHNKTNAQQGRRVGGIDEDSSLVFTEVLDIGEQLSRSISTCPSPSDFIKHAAIYYQHHHRYNHSTSSSSPSSPSDGQFTLPLSDIIRDIQACHRPFILSILCIFSPAYTRHFSPLLYSSPEYWKTLISSSYLSSLLLILPSLPPPDGNDEDLATHINSSFFSGISHLTSHSLFSNCVSVVKHILTLASVLHTCELLKSSSSPSLSASEIAEIRQHANLQQLSTITHITSLLFNIRNVLLGILDHHFTPTKQSPGQPGATNTHRQSTGNHLVNIDHGKTDLHPTIRFFQQCTMVPHATLKECARVIDNPILARSSSTSSHIPAGDTQRRESNATHPVSSIQSLEQLQLHLQNLDLKHVATQLVAHFDITPTFPSYISSFRFPQAINPESIDDLSKTLQSESSFSTAVIGYIHHHMATLRPQSSSPPSPDVQPSRDAARHKDHQAKDEGRGHMLQSRQTLAETRPAAQSQHHGQSNHSQPPKQQPRKRQREHTFLDSSVTSSSSPLTTSTSHAHQRPSSHHGDDLNSTLELMRYTHFSSSSPTLSHTSSLSHFTDQYSSSSPHGRRHSTSKHTSTEPTPSVTVIDNQKGRRRSLGGSGSHLNMSSISSTTDDLLNHSTISSRHSLIGTPSIHSRDVISGATDMDPLPSPAYSPATSVSSLSQLSSLSASTTARPPLHTRNARRGSHTTSSPPQQQGGSTKGGHTMASTLTSTSIQSSALPGSSSHAPTLGDLSRTTKPINHTKPQSHQTETPPLVPSALPLSQKRTFSIYQGMSSSAAPKATNGKTPSKLQGLPPSHRQAMSNPQQQQQQLQQHQSMTPLAHLRKPRPATRIDPHNQQQQQHQQSLSANTSLFMTPSKRNFPVRNKVSQAHNHSQPGASQSLLSLSQDQQSSSLPTPFRRGNLRSLTTGGGGGDDAGSSLPYPSSVRRPERQVVNGFDSAHPQPHTTSNLSSFGALASSSPPLSQFPSSKRGNGGGFSLTSSIEPTQSGIPLPSSSRALPPPRNDVSGSLSNQGKAATTPRSGLRSLRNLR